MDKETLDDEDILADETSLNGASNRKQNFPDDAGGNNAALAVATTNPVCQDMVQLSTLMNQNTQHVNHEQQLVQSHESEQQEELGEIQDSQQELQQQQIQVESQQQAPLEQQSPSLPPQGQYLHAVCHCVCTCETCEEMNGIGETEESMQICVCSHECSEEECGTADFLCSCDDHNNGGHAPTRLPAGLSLYALHCCSCGVQLSTMEVCPKDPEEQPNEVRTRPQQQPQQPQRGYCACGRQDITNNSSDSNSNNNDVQENMRADGDRGDNLTSGAQPHSAPDRATTQDNVSSQSPAPTAEAEEKATEDAGAETEASTEAPPEAAADITTSAAAGASAVAPPPPPPPPPQGSIPSRGNIVPPEPLLALSLLRALSSDDGMPNDSRLHEAARAGRADLIESLLQDPQVKKNINSRVKPFMSTPLREAVVSGSAESVAALLRAGPDVDGVDVKGQTPLFLAACLNQPAIMELLLAAGADPEGSRYNNCTPLLICVREGIVEGVQALLRHGADPQPVSLLTTCVPGWPLQHSVVYRRYRCFLALLRGGAEPCLASVLARRDQALAARALDTEGLDPVVLHRLSIVRTALRYASDRPEFILAYREFGGAITPGDLADPQLGEQHQGGHHQQQQQQQQQEEELQLEPSAAAGAVAAALEAPLSLLSQSRLSLLRVVGAPRMGDLALQAGLPSSLRAYLAYSDLDKLAPGEETP